MVHGGGTGVNAALGAMEGPFTVILTQHITAELSGNGAGQARQIASYPVRRPTAASRPVVLALNTEPPLQRGADGRRREEDTVESSVFVREAVDAIVAEVAKLASVADQSWR